MDFVLDQVQSIEPHIQSISKFKGISIHNQFYETLSKAILIRQFEAINAIIKMAEAEIGHFGVTLLRPAFEELLWLEYLSKHQDKANEIIYLLERKEIGDQLRAQEKYIGRSEMRKLGFGGRYLKQIAADKSAENELKILAASLDWGKNNTGPKMSTIASQTRRRRDYDFFYHATSRYVHFSTHELFRRTWGQRGGSFTITSDNFANYWSQFALYWGVKILLETVTASDVANNWPGFSKLEAESALEELTTIPQIPIITWQELQGWD